MTKAALLSGSGSFSLSFFHCFYKPLFKLNKIMKVNRSVVRIFDEPIECLLNYGSVGMFCSSLECCLLGITEVLQDIFFLPEGVIAQTYTTPIKYADNLGKFYPNQFCQILLFRIYR